MDTNNSITPEFGPEMVSRTKLERDGLMDIAAKCDRLTSAVTAYMSSGEGGGGLAWRMFEAHKACVDALDSRPT